MCLVHDSFESIVNPRYLVCVTSNSNKFTFLEIKSHFPIMCPFFKSVMIFLKLVTILFRVDGSVQDKIICMKS